MIPFCLHSSEHLIENACAICLSPMTRSDFLRYIFAFPVTLLCQGGVGKTTVLCNLAGYLCQKMNKKVLVIDADPQCNTTTYVLDADSFLQVYYEPGQFTLNDIVIPLKTRGAYIEPDKITILHSDGFGFDVIAGSPKLATSEDFLSGDWKDIKAGEIRGIRSNMIFFDLLRKCNTYDYVFFDMGPSLGAINRAILLACDFFITPNIDKIYEQCTHINSFGTVVIKKYYEDIAPFLRQSDYLVIKAHGCVDDPQRIVFTHKQYNIARYNYASFYRLLDALLLTNTFVFVGCGLSDPDIQLTHENANFSFPNCKPHYFITASGTISNEVAKSLLTNRNIKVLTYNNTDGTHRELLNDLKQLVPLVEEKRQEYSLKATW